MFPLTPKKKIVLKLFSIALLVLVVPQFAFAANWGQEILWTIVNTFFGMLVWIGGVFLNTAVTDYVVGFGELYKNSGLGFSIDNLWSVVRDLFNLTFIFGLVFIGFRMIFNSSDSSAQRLLVSLVLAGLLVNFSLFITKTVIDFSNIAATQIAAGFESAPGSGKYTVSDSFMNLMGVSSVFNTSNLTKVAGDKAGYPYIFGSLILYIVTAFVFMAGAMLLIIRFVVLNIYMVLSPLMFLGMVFPSMDGVSKEYWRGFLARAFFAPAYILMLYFSNQILVNMKGTTGAADFAKIFVTNGAAPSPADFSTTIPFFAMAIVFLVASLVIGQKMGSVGATNALALGKRMSSGTRRYVQGRVGSATFGTAAIVGQRTIGYGANKLANNKSFNEFAAKDKYFVGRAAMKASRAVANTSFDARQVGGLGKGLAIGEGRKGGYKSRIDEKNKADVEFAKSLKETEVKKENGKFTDSEQAEVIARTIEAERANPNSSLARESAKRDAARTLLGASEASLTQKENARKEAKVADEARIKQLEAQLNSPIELPEGTKRQVTSELENSRKAIADIDKSFETDITKLKAEITEAKKSLNEANTEFTKIEASVIESAESKIKYQNQLAFIEEREREANFYSSIPSSVMSSLGGYSAGVAGASAAGLGIAATGTAAGFGLALGAPILNSIGNQKQESVKNLRKIYGTDGTTRSKAKEKEENLRILTQQIDEATKGSAPVVKPG